jgi:tRNA(fMet)-specific endonuclease VapC
VKLLLDTDVCIYAINRRSPGPLARLREHALGDVGVSTVTYAELRYGVENSARPAQNIERLERFLLPLDVVPFDAGAARAYGKVRLQLKRQGSPIGGNDLLIAAHALSLGVTLVTNNVREFERVEGLAVARWS